MAQQFKAAIVCRGCKKVLYYSNKRHQPGTIMRAGDWVDAKTLEPPKGGQVINKCECGGPVVGQPYICYEVSANEQDDPAAAAEMAEARAVPHGALAEK